MIGLLSECIEAMRTTAKVNFSAGNLFLDCQMPRFFRQAGWAYNEIADLLQIFLRIIDEDINAALATEVVFLTRIAASCGLIFADLQPYQRTAASWANRCFHRLSPAVCYNVGVKAT